MNVRTLSRGRSARADLKKDANGFDLPIALGLLLASGQVAFDRPGNYAIVGELALTGETRLINKLQSVAQRTKVFRLQPRSHEERSNHAWLLSQAADGQVKFQMEFFHVEADQVAHLDMLEVLPGAFDGIQVRGIRRQPLDAKATSRVAGKELLDCGAAMDGRPVPDYQESRSDMPDQVLEELDGVQPVERLLTHQGVDLALRRDTPHDREVVARLPLVEDRRVPLGRVGPDLARQEVEARFIHENQGAGARGGPLP